MKANRINKVFNKLKANKQKAFIAYITAGDPNLKVTERVIPVLRDAGADMIEIGLPFSDPLADGPTIQEASQRALAGHVTLDKVFSMVKRLRRHVQIPLIFMTYYNPVFYYGEKKFLQRCAQYGIDGVIIPDLPPEEASNLIVIGRKENVATIFLASPTTTKDRFKKIGRFSNGFIYYISLTGVTGIRRNLPKEIVKNIKNIKRLTNKAICVGFGISTPQQVLAVAKNADGVIVGSAIVKRLAQFGDSKNLERHIYHFVEKLARACHKTYA